MSRFTRSPRRAVVVAAAALAAVALLGACGDDDDAAADEETTTTTAAGPGTLEIETTDYSFGDLPDTVAAGTTVTVTNASTVEVHEAVVFKLDESDDRSVDEIIAAGADSPEPPGEFIGVGVALPESEGAYPEGPIVLEEPGRYLVACFIPTGADPEVYAQAIKDGGGPPSGLSGAPHIAHGMFAEITVE